MLTRLRALIPPIEAGGLLPYVRAEHTRSVVDGSTVAVKATWLRIGATVELHLPFGSHNPDHEPTWRPW